MAAAEHHWRDTTRAWLVPRGTPLRAQWDPAQGRSWSDEDEATWRELCQRNPKLHDGAIVRASGFDPETMTFRVSPDSYRAFAVQEGKPAGVVPRADRFDESLIWLVGVKGWLVARDGAGHEHLMIARRSAQTRIYGLCWESAPAGAIEFEASLAHESSALDLTVSVRSALQHEAREELEMEVDAARAEPIVIVQDSIARSFDIFMQIVLRQTIIPARSPACFSSGERWEYLDAAWLSRKDATRFASAGAVSTPTCAAMAALGWIS
ncbi:MAG: hypothetical protein AB7G11_04415 [Phycisphaerales bacterium]